VGDPSQPDTPTTHMVPNPEYTALKALHDEVEGAQYSLSHALQGPAELMAGRDAWTGPTTAKAFAEDVSGRDQRLPGLVRQILEAVEDKMASTPKEVERPLNRGMIA
jgi:hypothetical protein